MTRNKRKYFIGCVSITVILLTSCEPIQFSYGLFSEKSNRLISDSLATFNQKRQGLVLDVYQLYYVPKSVHNHVEMTFQNFSSDTVFFPDGSPVYVASKANIIDTANINKLLRQATWRPVLPHASVRKYVGFKSMSFRGTFTTYKKRLLDEELTLFITYNTNHAEWHKDTVYLKPSMSPQK